MILNRYILIIYYHELDKFFPRQNNCLGDKLKTSGKSHFSGHLAGLEVVPAINGRNLGVGRSAKSGSELSTNPRPRTNRT